MAAGMGSRYGSLKQIEPVGLSGEAIIDYSVYDAIKAGYSKIVFVIRKTIEEDFKDTLLKRFENLIEVDYVFQELDMLPDSFSLPPQRLKPWGTAHAIMVAEDKISSPFAAINADDFYGHDAFVQMAQFIAGSKGESEYAMVGYRLKNTLSEHGPVSRGVCNINKDGFLNNVTERTSIKRLPGGVYFESEGKQIELHEDSLVSMNFWGFTPDVFRKIKNGFSDFLNKNLYDNKSEYYIPTLVDEIIHSQLASVKVLECNSRWFGITYREDKEHVKKAIHNLIKDGFYPESLWK